jgi:hypothetical protein
MVCSVVTTCPRFVDLEASGFSAGSYPISVAWNDDQGTIERLLIDPSGVASWGEADWSAQAESVHGLDRERLRKNGWPPDYVVERLIASVPSGELYSDAPEFDERWLDRLFTVVGIPRPFTVRHADDLLLPLLIRPGELEWQGVARLEALKERIRPLVAGHHDAGYDVGYLLQVWRAAQGQPVKMGHGIGPMPEISATGSFVRLKMGRAARGDEQR